MKRDQQLVPVVHSKTALLEGLEVDQYMLGILVYIQKWVLICSFRVNQIIADISLFDVQWRSVY